METHRTTNYIRTDCPICGCKNTRCVWQDEDGYGYYECDICEGCENGEDLANKLQVRGYVKELMRDGLVRQKELIETVAETLYISSHFISMGNAKRVASWIIPPIWQECWDEVNTEIKQQQADFIEYVNSWESVYEQN